MNEENGLVLSDELAKFREAFTAGINGIVQAAKIYVAAIDENPANADKFREYFSDTIPVSAWANFEAVGRKWMHPQLLLGGMADRAKANLVKRLPYDTQSDIIEKRKRYPLLLSSGDTLEVSIQDATPEQVAQLVDGSAIRQIPAQKAYLEQSKTRKLVNESEPLPYAVRDGRITFRRGITLTKSELRRILSEM